MYVSINCYGQNQFKLIQLDIFQNLKKYHHYWFTNKIKQGQKLFVRT